MANLFKRFSLIPQGLRHQLVVAFALMSVLPLFILVLVAAAFVFPGTRANLQWFFFERLQLNTDYAQTFWVSGLIIVTLLLIIIGRYILEEIVNPIIRIALEAKSIAQGTPSQPSAPLNREDELGDLTNSLNQINDRLFKNMETLRHMTEQTREFEQEIQKRVFAMSSLLQLGHLIAQGAELDTIFHVALEKLAHVEANNAAFVFLRSSAAAAFTLHATYNVSPSDLADVVINPGEGEVACERWQQELTRRLQGRSVALVPMTVRAQVMGILGLVAEAGAAGAAADTQEIAAVFAKQLALAYEKDLLLRTTKELSVHDELTGLYNETYIRQRLEEEIQRSIRYERPCAFVLLNIDNFKQLRETQGDLGAERMLKRVAQIVREQINKVDRAARFGGNEFAVVLPECNKAEAIELAEEIRRQVERTFQHNGEACHLTVSGGVAENPIDGATVEQLIAHARQAMTDAKAKGKNCVRA